ncbi:MAG: hypothetical protein RI883_1513 [Bacteroidota bacterium]|jgi:hypothetical protein
MKTKKQLFVLVTLTLTFASCQKNAPKLNEELYESSKATDLQFYKNKDTIYSGAGSSPHGSFKLKFNSIAVAALDAEGKLPTGASFPKDAVIVKEVYSGGELILYVVMKKDSKSKFQGEDWVWGEYKTDGTTAYSVADKGASCISCHSTGTNRDFVKSFDLH